MQIHSLHKNIYKLYSLVAPEGSSSNFEKLCEKQVNKQCFVNISRATYYRREKWPKSRIFRPKCPKNIQKSKFGIEVYNLIKQIRAENKKYGKAKICVILRSYFGINVSKRTPGFSGSRSALRDKKNAYLASMPSCLSLGNTPPDDNGEGNISRGLSA